MKTIILLMLLIKAGLCASEITVAVAANLSYVVEDLKKEFSRSHPDINVRVIIGSSGKLSSQIRNGAPYGLFMSADMHYPQTLFADKIALFKPQVYAQGTLAYFSTQERDFSKGIELLRAESIEKIALANPVTAPYGKAAQTAMENAGVYTDVKSKLVFAESVSQSLSYVFTAADIGIIASSSLHTKKMKKYKENIHWIEVNRKLYEPIKQGVVLLKHSENIKAYELFYSFILGNEAKNIFKKHGYLI